MWRASDKKLMVLAIPENCKEFRDYYDNVQENICQISVLDELLAGMLVDTVCGENDGCIDTVCIYVHVH